MSNEAAERLQQWVPEDAETQANFRYRVNAALAAERKATVERIRAAITAWDADTLRAMLDRFSWQQFVDTCMNDLDVEDA